MRYDLFISYPHRDNARGQVRELRDAVAEDFARFAGRELAVFFDEHDIPSMSDWEERIATGLRESRLFLAVLSPNYFASEYCRREREEYVRYEAMRQCLGEGVAPVYFVELPGLDEVDRRRLSGRRGRPRAAPATVVRPRLAIARQNHPLARRRPGRPG